MVKLSLGLLRDLFSKKWLWLTERDGDLVGIDENRDDASPNLPGFSLKIDNSTLTAIQDLLSRMKDIANEFRVSVELLPIPEDLNLARFAGLIIFWELKSPDGFILETPVYESWVIPNNPQSSQQIKS